MEIISTTTQNLEYPVNTPEYHFQQILKYIGEDVNREGLIDTPKRYIKFLKEVTSTKEFNFTTFTNEGGNELIIENNIPFYSLCEHHIVPFYGSAHVCYIPNNKIVGLSKIPRTVDLFSRRLQNQERITKNVAEFLFEKLKAKAVGVVLNAKHFCMCMRGVEKENVTTRTQYYLGDFKMEEKQIFLNSISHANNN